VVSRFVIARVLNHADSTMTGIYDRHEYLTEKREALEKWSSYLEGLVQLPPGKSCANAAAERGMFRGPLANQSPSSH
jgi:hypothetical protein